MLSFSFFVLIFLSVTFYNVGSLEHLLIEEPERFSINKELADSGIKSIVTRIKRWGLGFWETETEKDDNCTEGFSWNNGTCIDINECEVKSRPCRGKKICINTSGSFSCVSCKKGFKFKNNECVDIDECEDPDSCTKGEECINLDGSFNCSQSNNETSESCATGFVYSVDENDCVDEKAQDKCETFKECKEDEVCTVANGSFTCIKNITTSAGCKDGFELFREKCRDIDECLEETHNCKKDEDCENNEGGFICTKSSIKPTCENGEEYDEKIQHCTDVNECLRGTHDCKSTEVCQNKNGTYLCITRPLNPTYSTPTSLPSRQLNPTYSTPTSLPSRPLNPTYSKPLSLSISHSSQECQHNGQICEGCSWSSCQNTCPNGYIFNAQRQICEDIDECIKNRHACGPQHVCRNMPGYYLCQPPCTYGSNQIYCPFSCPAGTYRHDQGRCLDLNECSILNPCSPNHHCLNTYGSYKCIPKDCFPGFKFNDDLQRCERISCDVGFTLSEDETCHPIICPDGMVNNGDSCKDINECDQNPCHGNERCINLVGSYTCVVNQKCRTGYELNPQKLFCIDVNECSKGIHNCENNQICINHAGGYTCGCRDGYSLNSDEFCEDIDECHLFSNRLCEDAVCVNTPGSYLCRCRKGFRGRNGTKICEDIDECRENPGICEHGCVNSRGSYFCTCRMGFSLATDKRSCKDINECATYKCKLCVGICTNTPGSYSCTCPEGYRLSEDLRTCQDINECMEKRMCQGENKLCVNTRGSYRCQNLTCPSTYVQDEVNRNRCRRATPCQVKDTDCLLKPVSIVTYYISWFSNMTIADTDRPEFFTITGPRTTESIAVKYGLELTYAHASSGVKPAKLEDFKLLEETSFNGAKVASVQPVLGPQEIELSLTYETYNGGYYMGHSVAKLHIFVSEYEF